MSRGPAPGVATRVAAAQVVDQVLHRGASLKAALQPVLPTLPDPRDRALVEALVFAVIRQHARYGAALDGWMQRPLQDRDHLLRALLYVGFAQLDSLKLPAHAALDATVEAARALRRPQQAGMVNALLRRAQREGVPGTPDLTWPDWLRTRVTHAWPEDADAIFAASAAPAPLWLRLNPARTTTPALLAALADDGISARAEPGLSFAVCLDESVPVARLPGFDAGDVSVQDGSAQYVAWAVEGQPRMRILDACAAPGGKAAHLHERFPTADILALDVDARRVRRMEDTFRRLGQKITTRSADASRVDDWWDGTPFDVVVIDAPCSATGIVRRQPDVLLHRREADLATLTASQSQLLDALWRVVKPGGCLLYATCSILPEENAEQVRAFLARTPDATLQPLDARFGRDTGAGAQRLTGERGMDGFFIARMEKSAA